jgi:hydrophobic/amphiphilic exporter-1 (mainly G- bacteria), HAE1 family
MSSSEYFELPEPELPSKFGPLSESDTPMKKFIAWTIQNTPAMNMLMIAVLAIGAFSFWKMNREMFPAFELDYLLVTVPYPGATPEEVEISICQKIEQAVKNVDGIKTINSIAAESAGSVILELHGNVDDVQRVLNEVRSEVDRIPRFPESAEKPIVKQITMREPAIQIGLLGPDESDALHELQLRDMAEHLRRELENLNEVTTVDVLGGRAYQIDVEIPEATLREYGLTLTEVARRLRDQNLEVPGGVMKTESQEILLRGKNKYYFGRDIAQLPLVSQSDVVLTVGDLGTVRDEFIDSTAITRINGRPGLIVSASKTKDEDLLEIADTVRAFMSDYELPPGYEFIILNDTSVHVRDRLNLLLRNGLQGLVLVFLILALFLELRLAGWVALGIPISMMGAAIFMLWFGQTLNMLSMFAFILTLGILVDDAIVVGENVYHHREQGKSYKRAAIDGTVEVLPSITTSVLTTICAFGPLLFVSGVMGKFIFIIPIAVIAMLAVSLFECAFILPCHLGHEPKGPWSKRFSVLISRWSIVAKVIIGFPIWSFFVVVEGLLFPLKIFYHFTSILNRISTNLLERLTVRFYLPFLRRSLEWPALVVACGGAILIIALGAYAGGFIPMDLFPKSDAQVLSADISYPDGTPASVTKKSTLALEEAILRFNEKVEAETGESIVRAHYRLVGSTSAGSTRIGNEGPDGSHRGKVVVELVAPEERSIHSNDVLEEWRNMVDQFPGAERVSFAAQEGGPGGRDIEFRIVGLPEDMARIEQAVEECKEYLATFSGVSDIGDDSMPGKQEYQIRIRDDARTMGVSERELDSTIRAAYYGEEVMRLQRGEHEVKLMVRYPREERQSLGNFSDLRVRTGNGAERPITELADITVQRRYSQISRVDERRAIAISADVESWAKQNVSASLKNEFVPELLARPEYAGLRVRWEGQQQSSMESMSSLAIGLSIALCIMALLLVLEFTSYTQPLIIMAIIPFGIIGATVGHLFMGLSVTMMSVFGLVALTGVVVNDSIVLIDFINHRIRDGLPIKEALLDAGHRRIRPVLLTSMTTICGLTPLMMEKSFQAQYLIPMAVTLAFGLMFSTILVLLFVPTLYLIYYNFTGGKKAENKEDSHQ